MFETLDFEQIPFLLLKEDSITGYIDFITWERIKRPVVWGYDQFKRKFIIIKCRNPQKQKFMQTFFQRYSYHSEYWQSGRCWDTRHVPLYQKPLPRIVYTDGGLSQSSAELLVRLINEKTVNVNKWATDALSLAFDWENMWNLLAKKIVKSKHIQRVFSFLPGDVVRHIIMYM